MPPTVEKQSNVGLYALLATIVLFILGRLIGAQLFDNHWSFNHWQFLPTWYPIGWAVAFVALALGFWKFSDHLGRLTGTWIGATIGLGLIFVLLIWFRFDSFLYGEGNLRIAQIGQTDRTILRWFEHGSLLIVSLLYDFFLTMYDKSINAAVTAWQTFAFACTALSLVGSARLAFVLAKEKTQAFLIFVIVFFGPQTLLHFGFVGVEPAVITIITWFSLFAFQADEQRSPAAVGMLWLLALIGIWLHVWTAVLIPAAVFLTLTTIMPGKSIRAVAFVAALASYAGLVVALYLYAAQSLELSTDILFMSGKRPQTDYGIFGGRHIGDMAQLLFLAAPLVIAMKMIAANFFDRVRSSNALVAAWLMSLGSFTVLMVLDPKSGIVMDFPRLIVWLTPQSFLLALLVRETLISKVRPGLMPGLMAAAAVMFPLSYLPVYTSIHHSEEYVSDYMDQHDIFYEATCLAYRDAYFQIGEYPSADRWEWAMPTKSPDYLNLQGTVNLLAAGEFSDAITVLNNMIAKRPFTTGPRVKLAAAQMQLGHYDLAKPQIDTCLMLEPYNRVHHIHLYSFYRNTGRLPEAIKAVDNAHEIFPTDREIQTDQMLLNFRLGNLETADSLAHHLNRQADDLPFPHLILGMLEDHRQNPEAAIPYFEKFLELAPEEPEAPVIRSRLDSLRVLYPGAGSR